MKPFSADQFVPTKWDSAEQKAKFANHLIRFANQRFAKRLFTKWFYQRLSNCFGHIAEFNLHTFYEVWFGSPERQARFLENILRHPCYGDPEFTYSDVERAVKPEIQKLLYPLFQERV